MSGLMTNIGLIVTNTVTWIGNFMSCITTSGNEILQLFIILPVVGFAVGIIKRLLSL